MDYIYYDLWCPSKVISKGNVNYFLTFVDDYFKKIWVYFLEQKSNTFVTFKQCKALIENQTEKKIKYL